MYFHTLIITLLVLILATCVPSGNTLVGQTCCWHTDRSQSDQGQGAIHEAGTPGKWQPNKGDISPRRLLRTSSKRQPDDSPESACLVDAPNFSRPDNVKKFNHRKPQACTHLLASTMSDGYGAQLKRHLGKFAPGLRRLCTSMHAGATASLHACCTTVQCGGGFTLAAHAIILCMGHDCGAPARCSIMHTATYWIRVQTRPWTVERVVKVITPPYTRQGLIRC